MLEAIFLVLFFSFLIYMKVSADIRNKKYAKEEQIEKERKAAEKNVRLLPATKDYFSAVQKSLLEYDQHKYSYEYAAQAMYSIKYALEKLNPTLLDIDESDKEMAKKYSDRFETIKAHAHWE